MCSGAILQFGVPRVVVGEAETFAGDLDFLRAQGVEALLLDDPGCRDVMRRFLAEPGNAAVWREDISEE